MKSTTLCMIALAALASCESRDVVTGRARVTTFNSPAPVAQPAVKQTPAPAAPKVQAPKPAATPQRQATVPQPKTVTSQKQPKLTPVQQPAPAAAPAAARPAPRTTTSQVQPKQRVLTPQTNMPVKKKRVLMPGQNRGLMAR